MTVWQKLVELDSSGTKVNPLIYPFLLTTFAYGLGFTAFVGSSSVNASNLYLALESLSVAFPLIWGACALTVVALAALVILRRRMHGFGHLTGLLGAAVWIFALIGYIIAGGWLFVFAIAIPNLLFWVWFYIRLAFFKRFGPPVPPPLRGR